MRLNRSQLGQRDGRLVGSGWVEVFSGVEGGRGSGLRVGGC